MKNGMNRKILGGLLALCMVLSLSLTAAPVRVEAGINDWRQGKAELEQEKKDLKDKLAAAEKEAKSEKEKKSILDGQNAVLGEEISMLSQQIEKTSADIQANEELEKSQYELFCKQVRQEEERGRVSYWSVLFKATSFADLLSRVDFVSEVMEYDQKVMGDLRTTREQLAQDRSDLEEQKSALKESQAELEAQIAESSKLVEDLMATQEGYEKIIAEKEAASEEFDKKIAAWEEEQKRAPADTSSQEAILGGLIWPSDFRPRIITSKFGWRTHPIWGTGSFHGGIDIGPYGINNTPVLAAQDGTVIFSGSNGGYGRCVIIGHGHGVSTLYGHMNKLNVSEGQWVSRGETVGLCGSTGWSTGAHIHFEVRINGTRVDPLLYLDNDYSHTADWGW